MSCFVFISSKWKNNQWFYKGRFWSDGLVILNTLFKLTAFFINELHEKKIFGIDAEVLLFLLYILYYFYLKKIVFIGSKPFLLSLDFGTDETKRKNDWANLFETFISMRLYFEIYLILKVSWILTYTTSWKT